ncbi:MAG TPA: PDZ domain-containing protein [Fimbriimonadaceae bacterium]|nr:PDZ domain-containing protein [Fimbriimonadaceae bacterium]
MSEVKKGILATVGVALGAVAVISGTAYRNSVDLGLTSASQPSLAGLVASAGKDQDIPESAYFDQLADLLKSEYVDDIADQMKLADGAVRGMVTRLDDPHCLYFDAKNLAAYKDALAGKFQGIGAAFILRYANEKDEPGAVRLPRLIVAEIAKGGSADKAGLRPGDVITSIDNHWVINSDEIEAFRKLVTDKNTPSEVS